MIDFDRFWMDRPDPYADEDADETEVPRGVTAEEIRAWEEEHRVTLPEPIRTALGRRNGGSVRNTSIEIRPLDQILPVDDDFWEWTEIDEDEAPDHALMFVFGDEAESGATILMNFNARGPEGPPSVYFDHHGESTYLVNETIAGFFEAQLAASDGPGVNWSEAEASRDVLARETIDLSSMHAGRPASKEQILAREGEALIL
ncbi:MAG TPA: SMI1/KNR4 family protein, partial [Isosphaeraceae bacterium]